MPERTLQKILDEYYSLGINNQIDWEKFYLYSIITHSTAIEGSTVTEVEAQLLFDEGITSSKRTITEQMMNLDLKNAYEYGIKWIMQHPEITVNSLISLSAKVMARTGSEYHTITGDFSAAKGELRKVNVTAGIGGVSYMAYQKVPAKLESFCQKLNELRKNINPKDISSVYKLSFWVHYELVTIHPWVDGNGRMSRLLTTLLLYRSGFYVGKYISLEAKIAKNKDLYYDTLIASQSGWYEGNEDIVPFLKYLLGTILAAYKDFEDRFSLGETKHPALETVRLATQQKIGRFSKQDIRELCPSLSLSSLEGALRKMVASGELRREGNGKITRYYRLK